MGTGAVQKCEIKKLKTQKHYAVCTVLLIKYKIINLVHNSDHLPQLKFSSFMRDKKEKKKKHQNNKEKKDQNIKSKPKTCKTFDFEKMLISIL